MSPEDRAKFMEEPPPDAPNMEAAHQVGKTFIKTFIKL